MLTQENIELLEMVYEDLLHIQQEAHPGCSEHQLRRISVQLRNLLIEDRLIQGWKLLTLEPKQPIIVAPRLYTHNLDPEYNCIAGGAQTTGGTFKTIQSSGKAPSEAEIKAMYEKQKNPSDFSFPLSEYKDSASVFARGKVIKRRHIVAFIANKKGGAHLDTSRKKDEELYKYLDSMFHDFALGGTTSPDGSKIDGGKTPIFVELMSIAQCIVKSPDIIRLLEECKKILRR